MTKIFQPAEGSKHTLVTDGHRACLRCTFNFVIITFIPPITNKGANVCDYTKLHQQRSPLFWPEPETPILLCWLEALVAAVAAAARCAQIKMSEVKCIQLVSLWLRLRQSSQGSATLESWFGGSVLGLNWALHDTMHTAPFETKMRRTAGRGFQLSQLASWQGKLVDGAKIQLGSLWAIVAHLAV